MAKCRGNWHLDPCWDGEGLKNEEQEMGYSADIITFAKHLQFVQLSRESYVRPKVLWENAGNFGV